MDKIFKRKNNSLNFEELDEKNIILGLLEIVASKKCNLACEHCMRGDAKNEEISKETYDAIFEKVSVIENLNLGGGEISLSPVIIANLVDSLEENNVIVNSFAVTTNGTFLIQEYIDELLRLKAYIDKCRDKNITAFTKLPEPYFYIVVSTDDFHLDQMIKNGYTLDNLLDNIKRYREAFGDECIEFKGYCDFEVLDEGRAKKLPEMDGINKVIPKPLSQRFSYTPLSQETSIIDGFLSISSDGEVLPGCNFSFENEKIFSAGNIRDKKLSEIFKNINLSAVPLNKLNRFRNKTLKAESINLKAYKKYDLSVGRKKEAFFWLNSQPEKDK